MKISSKFAPEDVWAQSTQNLYWKKQSKSIHEIISCEYIIIAIWTTDKCKR